MITVYSSSTCPKCKVLKLKLEKAGIAYEANENMEEMEQLGFKSLPMMKLEDGQILDFGAAVAYVKEATQ